MPRPACVFAVATSLDAEGKIWARCVRFEFDFGLAGRRQGSSIVAQKRVHSGQLLTQGSRAGRSYRSIKTPRCRKSCNQRPMIGRLRLPHPSLLKHPPWDARMQGHYWTIGARWAGGQGGLIPGPLLQVPLALQPPSGFNFSCSPLRRAISPLLLFFSSPSKPLSPTLFQPTSYTMVPL